MKNIKTPDEKQAFNQGIAYAKTYIQFCIANYPYKFNLGGLTSFFHDLCNFIQGTNHIPNKHNLTFKEFCEKYDVKDL